MVSWVRKKALSAAVAASCTAPITTRNSATRA